MAAAPMAPLPCILGQQQLQSRLVAGEEHHLLLDGFIYTYSITLSLHSDHREQTC